MKKEVDRFGIRCKIETVGRQKRKLRKQRAEMPKNGIRQGFGGQERNRERPKATGGGGAGGHQREFAPGCGFRPGGGWIQASRVL